MPRSLTRRWIATYVMTVVLPWLSYDTEAARRIAYQIAHDQDASDEDVDRANAFLELTSTLDHRKQLRKEWRKRPGRCV
jgi:hypothetical protein